MNRIIKFVSVFITAGAFLFVFVSPASAAPCTLAVQALPSPQAQIVTVGTNDFEFTRVKFSAPSNCSITLKKVVVGTKTIPASLSSLMIKDLEVFNGSTGAHIGATITVPSTANVIGTNLNITIPAGTSIIMNLRADVIGVGSGGLKLGVIETKAVKTGTNMQVGNANDYWGKKMTIIQPSCTPSITVTTPNGGESYVIGSGINVKWVSTCLSANTLLEVNVYNQAGQIFGFLAPTGTLNDGVETFSTAGWPAASDYKIVVGVPINGDFSNSALSVWDESNNYFAMNNPAPVITGDLDYYRMDYGTGDLPIDANATASIGTFEVKNNTNESVILSGVNVGVGNTTVALSNLTNLRIRVYTGTPAAFTEYAFGSFLPMNGALFTVSPNPEIVLAPGERRIVDIIVDVGSASSGEITQLTFSANGIGVISNTFYPIGVI